jgi:hypothetical protein
MNVTQADVLGVNEGEVFQIDGKTFRLEKKTSTAIAVRRYFWFDAVCEWLTRTRPVGRS